MKGGIDTGSWKLKNEKKTSLISDKTLLHNLSALKEYIQLAAILREQYLEDFVRLDSIVLEKERKQYMLNLRKKITKTKTNPLIKNLNATTLDTVIEFNATIPLDIDMKEADFFNDTSIENFLKDKYLVNTNHAKQQALNEKMEHILKRKERSKFWDKITDFLYGATQAITPLASIPLLNVVVNPLVNGLWGVWYASWAISIGYDPGLGKKYEPIKSGFNIASYIMGGLYTIAIFSLLIPPLWPIAFVTAPLAAVSLLASNVLWAAGAVINLYKEVKEGKSDAGRKWRIASHVSTVLYITASVVIATLAVAALFTPVGWAVGTGAIAFAVGAAVGCLATFAFAKFCNWRAQKNMIKQSNAATTLMQKDLKTKKKVSFSFIKTLKSKVLSKQSNQQNTSLESTKIIPQVKTIPQETIESSPSILSFAQPPTKVPNSQRASPIISQKTLYSEKYHHQQKKPVIIPSNIAISQRRSEIVNNELKELIDDLIAVIPSHKHAAVTNFFKYVKETIINSTNIEMTIHEMNSIVPKILEKSNAKFKENYHKALSRIKDRIDNLDKLEKTLPKKP